MRTSQTRCGAVTTSAIASATQGRASPSALRASRSSSRNSASGTASTTTKYFAHSAMPTAKPSSSQCIMRPRRSAAEGIAGQRPERQLNHVVIELGGGVVEVVQPVEDQHRDQRAGSADQRPRSARPPKAAMTATCASA